MARSATTTDAYNGIAEGRRQQIIDLLDEGERSVAELVTAFEIAQPRYRCQASTSLRFVRSISFMRSTRGGARLQE